MKLTHRELKKQIVDFLRWHKWLVIPIQQSMGSYRGIADLWVSKRHDFGMSGDEVFPAWVELKTGKDKQREYQIKFEDNVTAAGCRYWLIRSLEDLKSILRDLGLPEGKE